MRTYPGWQKRNESAPVAAKKYETLYFLAYQPNQETASFQHRLAQCPGDWVIIASAPVQLAPFALREIYHAIAAHPQADLIYADGDWLDLQGRRSSPWMKPALGLDSLRSQNYITPFFAIRKSLGDALDWLRPQAGQAWAEDLVWRAVEQARQVVHIPQVLYHQIAEYTQEARIADFCQDEQRVLAEHLQRMGLQAKVEVGPAPRTYRLRYALQSQPLVSIVIPSCNLPEELQRCVMAILAKSTYPNYEIFLVENNSHDATVFELYRQLQNQDARVRVMEYAHTPFNYAEINNSAAAQAGGDVLLFLNNDTEVIDPDWIERMLEYAQRPDVGAVGAKLYYPQDLIQHMGVIVGMYGSAGHTFANYPRNYSGYHYNALLAQNYSAVTAACLMTRRAVFEEVGGFDVGYRLNFNDIDLCLKMRRNGYSIVWTPYAQLYHHESLTRGYDSNTEMLARSQQEARTLAERWKHFLEDGDPYYNPNLALDRGYYSLRPGKYRPRPRAMPGFKSPGRGLLK